MIDDYSMDGNRNDELAEHVDWIAVSQIDDKIAETETRIEKLKKRRTDLKASGCTEAELAEIDRDLKYENNRLKSLQADQRAMMGYLD